MSGMNEARQAHQQKRQTIEDLNRFEEVRLHQNEIAIARYKACELLAKGNSNNGFTFPAIDSQTQVIDRHTNRPLSRGTVICDSNGNTAIIGSDGRPEPKSIAFTGDRDAVKRRMARFRGGIYAQPIAK